MRGYFARECRAPRNKGNRNRDAPTRNAPVDTSTINALVVQDGIGGYDWSFQTEEELINFSLMAYTSQGSSSSSSSDSKREALNRSNLEIIGYQIGLESLEARIVVYEKNEAVYEKDIAFLKYNVQVKDISIKEIKNQLENALKEKDNLKLKLEKFKTSSKSLTKLINSQISDVDKAGVGYDGQMNEIDLNDIHVNESEVLNNVFDSRESDGDDNQESDSEDENVFKPKEVKKTVKPSLEKIEFVNARNITVENKNKAEKPRKSSQSPRDAVLTKSGQVPVNAAKQISHRAAVSVSAAKRVNTAASRPNVNNTLPTTYSYFKAYSPVPRNNMYSFDLKNVVPVGGLTCLFSKATLDESNLWHRRLGHINCKTINKLVRGNLVRGLPSKLFENDHTCVACQKGKQHKASCPKSLEDEVADDAGKKSTEVPRKENGVQDPTKEGDKNDQEKDVRDQEEALRKQFEQESKRLFGQGEAANTNITNRLNTVSSPVNAISSSFTTVDPGRERAQRNEFESMFGQDKDANGNRMFTPVSATGTIMIEAIRLFLAYTSFMRFFVYQMDVKIAFLYGTIEEEVYVCQLPSFEDPHFPDKVYKVEKALYGLHQAPRAWYETLSTYLLEKGFRRGIIDKTLFIKNDIVKTSSTPIETNKALLKEKEADDVDIHLYRSMIRSLMYLTAFRPDIIYLKGQPKLGLWYPRDSPFDLEAFSDSDYAEASLDRKSTTGGCQFLGKRLISWQCKKQTVVANSITEAEYVVAANCYGQVLWIQNQMLDYGFNFMNTKIYIDNESTIQNPCFI
uniref:Putative ribonuclease H-like domain-containing protein n=1 Tax=Tanacetum cinerariifolium TaxID=118510 RepID=A0A6L2NBX1_TANCI|nr:putative ribonuclease H-like domain-containing protein [Tanacetum cinerariifolium]